MSNYYGNQPTRHVVVYAAKESWLAYLHNQGAVRPY